jgi:hypothetical protein
MHSQCHADINDLVKRIAGEVKLTEKVIVGIAHELQLLLHKHQDIIWKYDDVDGPLSLLAPDIILKRMGYQFEETQSLGSHDVNGETFEVAGLIDKEKKICSGLDSFLTRDTVFYFSSRTWPCPFSRSSDITP